MGWAIGYDCNWKRDIGYGVPAICDHPDCKEEIDRGLAHVCCGSEPYGGEEGCGLFFCGNHLSSKKDEHGEWGPFKCARCNAGQEPFDPKPDAISWLRWKLADKSWREWREENPSIVAAIKKRVEDWRASRRKNAA